MTAIVANDSFVGSNPGVGTAIQNLANVSPSDTDDLAQVCRWIMLGTAGTTLKVTARRGQTVVLTGLAAGVWHPIMASRIWNTSTDYTNIAVGW